MKRVLVAVVAVVVLAGTIGVFAGEQDFILINKTGLTIDEFYCSPTTTNDWEEDVLGVDVLESGEQAHIQFDRSETACKWDLKIVDEDGDAVIWPNIDLCKAQEITLLYQNQRPTAIVK